MKTKAQAGLDYLISYGWAFILIASFVGVLVFLLYPVSLEFECTVSDQKNFFFQGISGFSHQKDNDTDLWRNGTISLQNLSGSKMSIKSVKKEGYFYSMPLLEGKPCKDITAENPVVFGDKKKFDIGNLEIAFNQDLSVQASECDMFPGQENVFDKQTGKIFISFEDEAGMPQELVISCRGFPPKPS